MRLLLALALLLLTVPAMAQDALLDISGALGGGVPVTGGGPPAPSTITYNSALFSTIYDGLLNPVNAAVNGISGALAGWVNSWFIAAAACVLIALAIGSMLGRFQDEVVIRWGLRAGAVGMVAASAAGYQQWVSQPLRQLPTDIGHAVVGGAGTSFTSGGGPFDTLWNSLLGATDAVIAALPMSLMGVALMIVDLLCALVGLIMLFGAFAFYLITSALLSLLLAIGPLAVACMLFIPTRHFFSGWLNAVASQIVALVLISVILAIMETLLGNATKAIIAAPSTNNMGASCGALIGIAGALFLMLILIYSVRQIAVGMVGGVMAELGIATAAATAAFSGAGSAVSGLAGSSAPTSHASPAHPPFPARSLSRGGP